MLDDLLNRRLVMFTGKGGVGKSSCALAFAVAAARRGKRVLLAELTARSASSSVLGAAQAEHEPRQPRRDWVPNLWSARLEPVAALQEYLKEQLHSERLVKLATETRALARLWDAAPSVTELCWLNTLYHHEHAQQDGKPRWDLLVVDLPATGHALTLLGVPHGTLGMITVGALAHRARDIEELLQDAQRTALCVVTLAEELGINETQELVLDMRLRNALRVEQVVVNGLLPALDAGEMHADTIDGALGAEVQRALAVWRERRLRRQYQQQRLADLREFLQAQALPFTSVGHVVEPGFARVEAIARALVSEA